MKVLFLGGVFDDSHNEEIISKTRTYVEYAANNFQKKIIYGLRSKNIPLDVVSIPFLGAYPTAYSDIYFTGFKNMLNDKSGYKYYNFNNTEISHDIELQKEVFENLSSIMMSKS